MRILVLILMLGTALLVPAVAGDVQSVTEVKQAQVGQTLILNFPGNRKAARRWRFVRDRSKGLEVVDVDTLGWIISTDGNSPAKRNRDRMRFRVLAKAAGQADLTFEFTRRGWSGKYRFEWKMVRVVVTPATAAGRAH